ncbi:MAG: SGNH/GDSL hydrolase family protein [Eubacteriales bacterium]|nr:SGNH/GDSL hydrolase family protein [Eubacteriales bacterium]
MQKSRDIVLLGDSIAKGIVQSKSAKYELCSLSFAEGIAKFFDCKLSNWSRFGATIDKLWEIYERKSASLRGGETFILECGGNDCNFNWPEVAKRPGEEHEPLTGLERFAKLYGKLIERIARQGSEIIILNLPPLVADRFFNTISKGLVADNILEFIGGKTFSIYRWQEAYSNTLAQIANKFSVKLIDIRSPFLTERNYERLICTDGMHPNEKGHGLISRTLEVALAEYGLPICLRKTDK